jgi:osmotically-inducible protein OsmY
MTTRITSLGLPAALLAASLFAACENTARGIQQDTENNAAKAKAASEEAAPKIEQATADAKQAVTNAATATAKVLDAATQTMQVKMALMADKSIDGSEIHVETSETARTVTLKGEVPTAEQKATAERIAKAKAPDYTVVNTLVVKN